MTGIQENNRSPTHEGSHALGAVAQDTGPGDPSNRAAASQTTSPSDRAQAHGAVPQTQIREDSVSVFDKKAGDTSRSLVVIILVAALLLLLGIVYLTEPPTP